MKTTPDTPTEHRELPRTSREEQAWREIGVTAYAPGVRPTLLVLFLLVLLVVPAIQMLLPATAFERLTGSGPQASAQRTEGRIITADVAAVSARPIRNSVYADSLMHLHLINPDHMETNELLLAVMGMRERVLLPAADIQVGDRITVSVQPWSSVSQTLSGIHQSTLEDARYLLMDTWFADAIHPSDHSGMPGSGRSFLGLWRGTGRRMAAAWQAGGACLDRMLGVNRVLAETIDLYETELDEQSALALGLRAPVQRVLSTLGAGNEASYIGTDGWLFYRPDVLTLTGPGFLEPRQLRKRIGSASPHAPPPQPDPRPAILDFHAQLAHRGIRLMLLPTPVKPSIHPEKLGAATDQLIRNRSFEELLAELRAAGVQIHDPAPLLMSRKTDGPQYLAGDTHWTPEAMMAVAADLAASLDTLIPPPPTHKPPAWHLVPQTVTHAGDTATMLQLSDAETAKMAQSVSIQVVRTATGQGWTPTPSAEIMLLGDSFSNIYSLGDMGWGAHAGLAEHLSYARGEPIDRLTRNDNGATTPRRLLADALKTDPHRLDRTRLVIWQFSERELAQGDWQPIRLPDPPTPQAPSPPTTTNTPTHTNQHTNTPTHLFNPHTAFKAAVDQADATDAWVVTGTNNWRFLTAELRHLAHGPFWGPHAPSQAADPLHAITDLHAKLAELGIRLILCPAPPRAAIYPDRILPHVPTDADGIPLRVDPDLMAFYQTLRERGVTVIDLTDDFLAARRDAPTQPPLSCEQDSHWSPRGLECAAARVADAIRTEPWLADVPRSTFTVQPPETIHYTGDLAAETDTPRAATITRITAGRTGTTPLAFDPESPILVLADSHGLVFSSGDDMHCTAAGFGEHLSAALGFPVDLMARRGSGDQIRRDLARRFLTTSDAATKRILVYTFAARTLTESDRWDTVPLSRQQLEAQSAERGP